MKSHAESENFNKYLGFMLKPRYLVYLMSQYLKLYSRHVTFESKSSCVNVMFLLSIVSNILYCKAVKFRLHLDEWRWFYLWRH